MFDLHILVYQKYQIDYLIMLRIATADNHSDDGGRFIGGVVVIPIHPPASAAVTFLNKLLIKPARYTK